MKVQNNSPWIEIPRKQKSVDPSVWEADSVSQLRGVGKASALLIKVKGFSTVKEFKQIRKTKIKALIKNSVNEKSLQLAINQAKGALKGV